MNQWRRFIAALIVSTVACAPEREAPDTSGAATRHNVLLIVIDTLRADRLGVYGNPRNTTPNIDALAERGIRFENAHSQAPWTTPSIGSLLTSRYPTELGIGDAASPLPRDQVLLSEVLADAGYATGGVVSHTFVSKKWGFSRGFDWFDESNIEHHAGISSPGVTSRAIDFLRMPREAPFFLFVHYFDPHYDYLEHSGFEFAEDGTHYAGWIRSGMPFSEISDAETPITHADAQELLRLYDSELAFTDHYIGRLIEELDELGLLDDTLIVLTGDHGEEFLDHGGVGHTRKLFEELTWVPLILVRPGGEPGVVREPVALIDIFPTVLDVLGIPPPVTLRGRSLIGAGIATRRPIFSETSRGLSLRSVVSEEHKLIVNLNKKRVQLYDLSADPGERNNLRSKRPDVTARLRAALDAWRTEMSAPPSRLKLELSSEEEERLRSMGYIE